MLLCYNSIRKRKEVGNNMNTLTYNCLADHRMYVMTCKDESLDTYMKMMFENDVYKVNLNDEVEFTSYSDYEQWKKVANNINTLTYNLKNDFNNYVITCNDEWLDMYMELLFENGAYRVNLNNNVVFADLSTYESWKQVMEE